MKMHVFNGVLACFLSVAPALTVHGVTPVHGLSKKQMLQDFDQLTQMFDNYYAPMQYKDSVQNLNIDENIKSLRKEIKAKGSKFSFAQILRRFATIFKDAHIAPSIYDQVSYSLPFTFEYAQGVFVVSEVYDQSLV